MIDIQFMKDEKHLKITNPLTHWFVCLFDIYRRIRQYSSHMTTVSTESSQDNPITGIRQFSSHMTTVSTESSRGNPITGIRPTPSGYHSTQSTKSPSTTTHPFSRILHDKHRGHILTLNNAMCQQKRLLNSQTCKVKIFY